MMLRDSIALRTEVETRIWMGVHMLAKLAVMGVHMDLSPPYLEPLLINKKVVADNRRFKRRDAAQIPPNTATRRMDSTESNAQRTVRKGKVDISSKSVTPMTISSQEALQWTFISAFDFSFMSECFTLPQQTSCKLDIDFVTMTL